MQLPAKRMPDAKLSAAQSKATSQAEKREAPVGFASRHEFGHKKLIGLPLASFQPTSKRCTLKEKSALNWQAVWVPIFVDPLAYHAAGNSESQIHLDLGVAGDPHLKPGGQSRRILLGFWTTGSISA